MQRFGNRDKKKKTRITKKMAKGKLRRKHFDVD